MEPHKVKIRQFSGLPLSSMHSLHTWSQKSCKSTICIKDLLVTMMKVCYLVFALLSCFLLHLQFDVSAASKISLAISVQTDAIINWTKYII